MYKFRNYSKLLFSTQAYKCYFIYHCFFLLQLVRVTNSGKAIQLKVNQGIITPLVTIHINIIEREARYYDSPSYYTYKYN